MPMKGRLGRVVGVLLVQLSVAMARMEFVNVALLATPRFHFNELAVRNSVDLINRNVLRPAGNGLLLDVYQVDIRTPATISNEALFSKNLSKAAFILEAEHTDALSSCLSSQILRVPLISLVDRHKTMCRNVISMRPSDKQLIEATIDMIREDKPKIVAVIAEDTLGELVARLLSFNQKGTKFYFQIIAIVAMNDRHSLIKAVKELEASGMKKVLLLFNSVNLETVMREVDEQKLLKNDFRWYTSLTAFPDFSTRRLLDGLIGLEVPVDKAVLNQTLAELRGMRGRTIATAADTKPVVKIIDPLLHDALRTIAEGLLKFVGQPEIPRLTGNRANYCPVRKHGDQLHHLLTSMRGLIFEGMTGDVRFTKSGYRTIKELDVNEVHGTQKTKLGTWSAACRNFKWEKKVVFEQPDELPKCRKEEQSQELKTFKPRNRFLKIVTVPEEPFVIFDPRKYGNDRFTGFCKDLIDRLAKELEFTYRLYIAPDNNFGAEVNGTWNGMMKELIIKQADVALGSVTITADRETVIDFTKPFMDFTMSLILKRPTTPELDVFAFLKPFTTQLWFSILAMTFAVTAVMWFVDRHSPAGYRNTCSTNADIAGDEFNLANSLWFATSSMLQQGADCTPKNTSGRVLSGSFWFFILIIIATYTANLAAFFTTSQIKNKINSLDELANQKEVKYGIKGNGQTYTFFKTTQIPLYHRMYTQLVEMNGFESSTVTAIAKVQRGNFAYLTEDPVNSFFNQKQPCNTMLLQNLLESKSYGLGLQSNSEWTNPLSVKILRLRESGFIESIRMKWWDDRSECVVNTKTATAKPVSLELRNMAGVYVILLAGTVIAFSLLLYEIKVSSWLKKKFGGKFKMQRPQIPSHHHSSSYAGYQMNGVDGKERRLKRSEEEQHRYIDRMSPTQRRSDSYDYPDSTYFNARESTL